MTSRTTPVGILVIALASLIAVGCTAQTGAVFEALIDPAWAPASSSEVDSGADDAADSSATVTWWPHPDGYAMELPAGWAGVGVDPAETDQLIDAVGASYPGLADRFDTVLADTKSRVSAIAADRNATGDVPPILLVLAQPTEGRRAHAVKTDVRQQINDLPGLSGGPLVAHDVVLPTAKGIRFDYTIDDPDLGQIRVRSYLFRYGSQAYLVNFVASEGVADEAEALFDAIANSLRFGV